MPGETDISCINLSVSPTNLNLFINTLCVSQGNKAIERAVQMHACKNHIGKDKCSVVQSNFYIHNYENLLAPSLNIL